MGTINKLATVMFGGARRDRTADLNTASVALSQLSYGPWEIRVAPKAAVL